MRTRLLFLILAAMLLEGMAQIPSEAGSYQTPVAAWPAARVVAATPGASEAPSLALEANGRVHVAWAEAGATANIISYTTSSDWGNSWTPLETITSTITQTRLFNPSIALDAGKPRVAWSERAPRIPPFYDIFTSEKPGGAAAWSTAQEIATFGDSRVPYLLVDVAGRAHLLWEDDEPGQPQIFYSSLEAGSWITPTNVSTSTVDSFAPSLALDAEGNLHAVWHRPADNSVIQYSKGSRSDSGVTWSSPITISGVLTQATYPRITSSGGGVYVVWSQRISDTQAIYFTRWVSGTGWLATPLAIPGSQSSITSVPPYSLVALNPVLASDGLGNLHVAWHGMRPGDTMEEIYYSTSWDGGTTWSEPLNISHTSGASIKPTIATLPRGTVAVVWQDYSPGVNPDIYFAHSPFDLYLPAVMRGYPGGW